jgi:uncharacterized membrane protein YagU involved in acid resistance
MAENLNGFLIGAVAGLAATVPMTVMMEIMHRNLPYEEQYPLPPRTITMKAADAVDLKEKMGETERTTATLVSHFAYGAAMGALYAPLRRKIRLAPPPLAGACYGLAVWAGSYLGLLPALGVLRPATEHPARRTALMIAAHLVWGAALGAVLPLVEDDSSNALGVERP